MTEQTFSVRAFGAAGDGTADDTRAFLEAAERAEEVRGQVLVPPGEYRLTDTIRLKGATLVGAPEGAFCADENVQPVLRFGRGVSKGLYLIHGAVSGVKLEFPDDNEWDDGVRQIAVYAEDTGCRVSNLKIHGAWEGIICNDFVSPETHNPGRLNVENVFMRDIRCRGLFVGGGLDVACIRNVEVWSPGSKVFAQRGIGFHFLKNDGIHISDCFAFNCDIAFLFDEAHGLEDYNGGTLAWLTNCNVDFSDKGIVIRGRADDAELEHTYPTQITVSGGSYWCHHYAVYVESGLGNLTMNGADLRANGSETVRIAAGDSVALSSCLIRREFAHAETPAVRIDGGRNVALSSNIIKSRNEGIVLEHSDGAVMLHGNILDCGGEAIVAPDGRDFRLHNLVREPVYS